MQLLSYISIISTVYSMQILMVSGLIDNLYSICKFDRNRSSGYRDTVLGVENGDLVIPVNNTLVLHIFLDC